MDENPYKAPGEYGERREPTKQARLMRALLVQGTLLAAFAIFFVRYLRAAASTPPGLTRQHVFVWSAVIAVLLAVHATAIWSNLRQRP
jgi:hypothetical protein